MLFTSNITSLFGTIQLPSLARRLHCITHVLSESASLLFFRAKRQQQINQDHQIGWSWLVLVTARDSTFRELNSKVKVKVTWSKNKISQSLLACSDFIILDHSLVLFFS